MSTRALATPSSLTEERINTVKQAALVDDSFNNDSNVNHQPDQQGGDLGGVQPPLPSTAQCMTSSVGSPGWAPAVAAPKTSAQFHSDWRTLQKQPERLFQYFRVRIQPPVNIVVSRPVWLLIEKSALFSFCLSVYPFPYITLFVPTMIWIEFLLERWIIQLSISPHNYYIKRLRTRKEISYHDQSRWILLVCEHPLPTTAVRKSRISHGNPVSIWT